MKLTKEDIELFQNLSKSGLGAPFIDYLDRLSDNICNSRNWKDDDTKESTTKAAEYIKKNIRDKIQAKPRERNPVTNEYE